MLTGLNPVLRLALVAGLVMLAAGSARAAGLGDGLAAYYDFDQTSGALVPDVSGHGLDGTIQNTADLTWVPGQAGCGEALDFGTAGQATDYVAIPNGFTDTIAGSDAWTISLWVYLRGFDAHGPVLLDVDTGGYFDLFLQLSNGAPYVAFAAVGGGIAS